MTGSGEGARRMSSGTVVRRGLRCSLRLGCARESQDGLVGIAGEHFQRRQLFRKPLGNKLAFEVGQAGF